MDLATACFGNARVSCWTCEEDRQWGIFGRYHQRAAVMHFQMQALPGSNDCKISDFELDLSFSPVTEGRGIPAPTQHQTSSSGQHGDHAEICLIGAPAPRSLSHNASLGTQQTCCWKFWSSRVSDNVTGRAFAARWMWEAKDGRELEGRILHGGVAVRHPGSPFLVTCHVRGRVAKSNGIKIKFRDDHHEPHSWELRPDVCDQDLHDHIDNLDANIQRLNKPRTTCKCCKFAVCGPFALTLGLASGTQADQDQHQGQHQDQHQCPTPSNIYGFTFIGGGARVHMGNTGVDVARGLLQPEPV